MSTRALVRVYESAETPVVMLYSSSDSYPAGLGRNILDFMRTHPTAPLGAKDYSMQLLQGGLGLECITTWDDRVIDWVYDIRAGRDQLIKLEAREVDWTDRRDDPQLERLCAPIDLPNVIAESDAAEKAYRKHHEDLMASIGNCPFCGLKGAPDYIPGGVRIKCLRYACRPRQPNVLHPDLDAAVAAWNQFVAQAGKEEF